MHTVTFFAHVALAWPTQDLGLTMRVLDALVAHFAQLVSNVGGCLRSAGPSPWPTAVSSRVDDALRSSGIGVVLPLLLSSLVVRGPA